MEISNSNINNIIRCIVIKPEEIRPSIAEISLMPEIKEGEEKPKMAIFENDIREILNIPEGKDPLFTCLSQPLQDFVLILNPDMLDNDSEYNFGYIGTPIFGNVVIIQTKIDDNQSEANSDEDIVTKVIPMELNVAEVIQTFFENNKQLEKDSHVYESITNEIKEVGKKEFIKRIVEANIEEGNYTEREVK